MFSAAIFVFLTTATNVAFAATTSYASRAPESTIEPSLTQIIATEATQVALSPVSNVQGKGFNRIIQIWLENTVSSQAFHSMSISNTNRRTMPKLQETPTCSGLPPRASLSVIIGL